MNRPNLLDRITQLEADLNAERLRSHTAAKVMYRRGYLAGHSAGRRNATPRGPNAKTKAVIGA